jgi:hypothetical protein
MSSRSKWIKVAISTEMASLMSERHFMTIGIHTNEKERFSTHKQFFRTQTRKTNETHQKFPCDKGKHPENKGRPTVPMPFILAAHIFHKSLGEQNLHAYSARRVSRVFCSTSKKKVTKVTHL